MAKHPSGTRPAFPFSKMSINNAGLAADIHYGMTFRQWLAAMATQGLLANGHIGLSDQQGLRFPADNCTIATTAVELADALIAELDKDT